jgi:hypothetical protein
MIKVTCVCGRALQAKDEYAGRAVRCPSCQATLTLPAPDAPPEVMDVQQADPEPYRAAPPPPLPPEPYRRDDYGRDVDLRRQPSRGSTGGGWGNATNAGVLGGCLMMVGAVVWFVLGLMNDIIFFYPPILLVIGLIAMIKGLMGGNKQ